MSSRFSKFNNASVLKGEKPMDLVLVLLTGIFFLNLYGYFMHIGLVLGAWFVLRYSKLASSVNHNLLLLFFFGLSYVLFASININVSARTAYAFIYLPWLVFNAGRANALHAKDEQRLLMMMLFFTASISFIYLYSVIESYYLHGVMGTRSVNLKFMSRTEELLFRSATGVSLHLSVLLPFLPVFLFANNWIGKKYLITGAILTLLSVFASALTATRFPAAILIILFVFVFVYNYRRQTQRKRFIMLLLFIPLGYFVSTMDYQTIEATAVVYDRFQDDDVATFGARTLRWQDGIQNVFKHPLGGEPMRYGYYHNLWLDLRKVAGVIPMFFFLLFSISSARLIIRILKSETISLQTKSILGSMFIVFFSMMFVESVFQGSPVFFLFYIFFVGFVYQLERRLRSM